MNHVSNSSIINKDSITNTSNKLSSIGFESNVIYCNIPKIMFWDAVSP